MPGNILRRTCCPICIYCDAPDASIIKVVTSGITQCGCTESGEPIWSVKWVENPVPSPNGTFFLTRGTSCSWTLVQDTTAGIWELHAGAECSHFYADKTLDEMRIRFSITAAGYVLEIKYTTYDPQAFAFRHTAGHAGTISCSSLILPNDFIDCEYTDPLDGTWARSYFGGTATLTWGAET